MSRYVNLDEKIKAMYFDEEHEEWNLKEETIESALNHVDYYSVFELVRCKDCKYYEQWTNRKICMPLGSYYGNTQPNDYCSYAERKEE